MTYILASFIGALIAFAAMCGQLYRADREIRRLREALRRRRAEEHILWSYRGAKAQSVAQSCRKTVKLEP